MKKVLIFQARQALPSLIFLLFAFTFMAFAQDGLYGETPPPDAAFVRIIQTNEASTPTIGNVSYGDLNFSDASPYRVILAGSHTLKSNNLEQELDVEQGKFYTVVLGKEAIMLEDSIHTNRAKALLNLYNLSDLASVDLKAADGKTDVLLEVTPLSFKSIEVNGITIDLAVFKDNDILKVFEERKLERAATYSAIVIDSETVIWVQSEAIVD